jgi:hypothetical protein
VGARGSRTAVRLAVAVVAALAGAGLALAVSMASSAAKGTQVRFLSPFVPQPNPFTPPADVAGATMIKFFGPFGGTGSNTVCDRELLIRDLLARPDRMRAWAQVEGIPANPAAVARFIRSLDPATLVSDTRVTDWSYANGRAYSFPAILEAGTAVLVDGAGNIRVRCYCGNPLTYPVLYAVETCVGCRAGYTLPEHGASYVKYPDPPPVLGQKPRPAAAPHTIVVKNTGPNPGPGTTGTQVITQTITGPGGGVTTTTVPVTQTQNQTTTAVSTTTVPGSRTTVTVTSPPTTTTQTVTSTATVNNTVNNTVTNTVTNTVISTVYDTTVPGR